VTLTFAVPFYSHPELLERALTSVMAQRNADWDAVVVDDAPVDVGAREIVERVGEGRIRYIENPSNLGIAGNWNRCLEVAETDLVTLFHADDELAPDYADVVLDGHGRFGDAVAVYTGATVIAADGSRHVSLQDEIKRIIRPRATDGWTHIAGEAGLVSLLRGQHIFCPTLCFRRDRLPAPAFRSEWRQVLDLDLLARLLLEGDHLVGADRVAYRYRRHAENQTAQLTASFDRFEEEFAIYDEIARAAAGRGWVRASRVANRAVIIRLHLAYRAVEHLIAGRPSLAAACLRRIGDRGRRS
jgi:glycosyltransferase involved in cell wall biosynthesis